MEALLYAVNHSLKIYEISWSFYWKGKISAFFLKLWMKKKQRKFLQWNKIIKLK